MKDNNLHNIKKTGFKTPDNYFESVEDNILNKLEEGLSVSVKQSGFEVPDSYFKSIEDNVFNRLDNTSESDVISSGFIVPDGYFETVEEKITVNISEKKNTKVVSLFSKRNILFASSIAAAIVIMFSIFNKSSYSGLETIETEILTQYLEDQNLNVDDIVSLLTEEELVEADFGINNDTFNEESLEDYLIDNIDFEDIIDQ